MQRYEMASAAWLAMVEDVLQAAITGARTRGELDGTRFSMCEVYTDVPPSVSDTSRVAWTIRVTEQASTFELAERDDVDIKVVGDWATLLRFARVEFGDEPPERTEAGAALIGAITAGRVRISGDPRQRPHLFAGTHDEIAHRTV